MDAGIGGPILDLLRLFIRAVGGSSEVRGFSETDKQVAPYRAHIRF
jgi:hypothetical protein